MTTSHRLRRVGLPHGAPLRKRDVQRVLIVAVAAGSFGAGVLGSLDVASAQQPREARRQFVQDLLKTLIDSQQEKSRQEQLRSQQHQHPHGSQFAPRPVPQVLPPQLLATRQALTGFSDECSRLINVIQVDSGRNPAMRGYLSDALKLKASTAVLLEQSQRAIDPAVLFAGCANLDRDWRVLKYRLGQLPGASAECRQTLGRLASYDQAMCNALNIQPQFDRTELIRQSASLYGELRHLNEDLSIEVAPSAARNQLLIAGRRLEQQARQLSRTVERRASHEAVVREYQQFYGPWQAFALQIEPLGSRFMERHVRHIQEASRHISELLWIPRQIDRRRLIYLTKVLERDVDKLFDDVSLNQLIELPAARAALPTASEFYGVCENFGITAQDETNLAELVEAYQYIDRAWPSFASCFRSLEDPRARQSLNEIEQSVIALREALGVRPAVDRRRAVQLAANLENMAVHLEQDMQRYLTQGAGRGDMRRRVIESCTAFRGQCHGFHEALVRGDDIGRLRERCAGLSQAWNQLQQTHVPNFNATEKAHLQRVAVQITPVMVDLQTLLAL